MRLFRRRRKFRRQVVKVEVDPGEVDALIDRGYIDPKDRDDLEVLAADRHRVLFRRSRDAVTASCNTVTKTIFVDGEVSIPGSPMETRDILLKADRIVVALERLEGGKIRATTASWDDHKVILRNQVLEVAIVGK